MIWFWKRKRKSGNVAEAQRDLDEARAARGEAERKVEVTRARWHVVHEVTSAAAELRKTNHLAEDIIVLFRGR